jgi:hypothetical protein
MATATSQYRALLQLVTDEALAMRRLKAAALAGWVQSHTGICTRLSGTSSCRWQRVGCQTLPAHVPNMRLMQAVNPGCRQELPTDPVTSCTHPEAEQGAARVPGPSLLDALPLDLLIEIAVSATTWDACLTCRSSSQSHAASTNMCIPAASVLW